MGQIIIEIPQAGQQKFRIISEESAGKIISALERIMQKEILEDDEDILGIWTVREKNAKKTAA